MRRILTLAAFATAFLSYHNSYGQRWNYGLHAPGEDVYKHYKGTLGGKEIVLDFRYGYKFLANYGGSTYYFASGDDRKLLLPRPDSRSHDATFSCREYPEDTSLTNVYPDQTPSPGWIFKIEGSRLKGTWHNATSDEHAEVDLVEDYSTSYPMEIAFFSNDLSIKPYPEAMTCAIPSSRMNREDAAYVTGEQIRFLSGGKINAKTWEEYERLNAGKFENMAVFMPVYNENGILVLENEFGNNILGDHKLSYLSLDVRNHKLLAADDMVNSSRIELQSLLEDAIRKKYSIPAGDKLSSHLLFDHIPFAKNVYPVHYGIVFCYNPGELAKAKEVVVCVPYRQLAGVLTPEFRRRVGLN